jgi:hypothetical protein
VSLEIRAKMRPDAESEIFGTTDRHRRENESYTPDRIRAVGLHGKPDLLREKIARRGRRHGT